MEKGSNKTYGQKAVEKLMMKIDKKGAEEKVIDNFLTVEIERKRKNYFEGAKGLFEDDDLENALNAMFALQNFLGREDIEDLTQEEEDLFERILDGLIRKDLTEGWHAFDSGNIDQALEAYDSIQELLEIQGREPNRKEQEFFNAIEETRRFSND